MILPSFMSHIILYKLSPYPLLRNKVQLVHPSGFIYTIVSMDRDNGPNIGKTQQPISTDIPARLAHSITQRSCISLHKLALIIIQHSCISLQSVSSHHYTTFMHIPAQVSS